jgi:large subunit ribosomal protein L16
MLLFPEKTKFKKYHKSLRKLKKKETKKTQPNIGFSGLKILDSFKITAKHIETVKKILIRIVKRKFKFKTKVNFNIFPNLPVTKKSSGIRMGKGKGNVDYWCFLAKKGRILFEFDNKKLPLGIIFNSFLLVSTKLSVKSLIIL